MSNQRLVFGGILLVVGGIFMIAVTFKGQREKARLDAEGVTVAGQVVGGEETQRRRGGRSYKLDVAYASADGKVRKQKTFRVAEEVYENAEVGGEVPVTFVPTDPEVARVGPARESAVGYVIGPVLLLAGAGMLVTFVRRRARG